MSLASRVQALVTTRGFSANLDFRATCVMQDDGNGPFIVVWNTSALGPVPQVSDGFSAPEVASITVQTAFTPPTLAQQYTAAISAGCAIVSTGTPAISGTYPTDSGTLSNMSNEVLSIAADGTFIGGGSTIVWPVAVGSVSLTVAQFTLIRKAVSGWVAAWDQYASGLSSVRPSLPVTIA